MWNGSESLVAETKQEMNVRFIMNLYKSEGQVESNEREAGKGHNLGMTSGLAAGKQDVKIVGVRMDVEYN